MDPAQIIDFALAQAKWLGLALLGAGIVVRLAGRAMGRTLLVLGLLGAAALAYAEWQAVHSLLVSGGILVAGVLVFGLLAYTVRGISFLFAFALLAAAFYLLVYGWAGPSFANSTTGSLVWAGATILTMIATGVGGRGMRGPLPAAGASH